MNAFRILTVLTILPFLFSCSGKKTIEQKEKKTIEQKVAARTFPSVFQAWFPIDMQEYPLTMEQQRLEAAAKHDLLWEEPLSQLGEGYDLVLGLVWDHENHGLATDFTKESLGKAKTNKKALLKLNENLVTLMEIRWRDAPSSFLPDNSDWWLRDSNGDKVEGWLGGWQPFYLLNYENEEFQDNIARQSKIAVESGVYDGIMLDWNGHIEIIKKVRKAIGDEKLIIVNIHDDIHDGVKYKDLINGSFMELNPLDDSPNAYDNVRDWDKIREALIYFEENLQEPRINCLEIWGERKDLPRMRAATTLGLVYSQAYLLYSDFNPLPTPDHMHDWYKMWDVELGNPVSKREERKDGAAIRKFENGTVVYNHYKNDSIVMEFEIAHKRISTGEVGNKFFVDDRDGDIFVLSN